MNGGYMAKGENIYVERKLLKSKAFLSLKTPTSCKVLFLFLYKRQFMQVGSRSSKRKWQIINNGQIEFTYLEANRYEISDSAFRRAIDELRNKGFIDIAETGQGIHKVKNLYSISDRWRDYGAENYRPPKKRNKGPVNRGFQKGNRLGRNCKKRPTVADNNGSTVADNNKSYKGQKIMLSVEHSEKPQNNLNAF